MTEELEAFLKEFFKLYDDLEEARPTLTGTAYERMGADILEHYNLESELFKLKCSIPIKQEIEKLKAREERVVPKRWERKRRFLLFFKKIRAEQNYMADLVDEDADVDAARFIADYKKYIYEKALAFKKVQEMEARAESGEHIQTTDSDSEESKPAQAAESATSDDSARLAVLESPAQGVEKPAEPPEKGADAGAENAPQPAEKRQETPKERAMREFNKKHKKE